MLASNSDGRSEADLLAVVRGADEHAAQAAFQVLWRRHEDSVSRFVLGNAPPEKVVPVKRSAAFDALRAKWLRKSKT